MIINDINIASKILLDKIEFKHEKTAIENVLDETCRKLDFKPIFSNIY